MPITSQYDERNSPSSEASPAVSVRSIVVLGALVAAAWIAAGSLGLLGHPLRHALTWLALAVAIAADWPGRDRSFIRWTMLAGTAVLALIMTASAQPAVNVLAVTLLAAALVRPQSGLHGRVVLIAALATAVLGIFRLTCSSIPTVWLAADAVGRNFGRLAGMITGEPLWIGAAASREE